jgi:hypothetical protein
MLMIPCQMVGNVYLQTLSACAAAIVKANIQSHVLANNDAYRHDAYAIWNVVELCVGILAASLPPLRPLFRRILETTKIRGRKNDEIAEFSGLSGKSARKNHYLQGQGIGLDSFPPRTDNSKYDARITSSLGSKVDSRWHSDEESGFGADSTSEFNTQERVESENRENIWPLQGQENGITKTVKVSLQRS